jgi:hypothetical protein
MSRIGQRGQAAVETVGMGVLVALLLAALSAWLVREVRPPARAPAFIEAVSKPLVRDPAPFEFRYPLPRPFAMPRGRDDEPIGRAMRMLARGARDGVVIGLEMRHEFAYAYGVRLRELGEEFLEDPIGGLVAVPDPELFTPESAVRQALLDARRLWDYGQELRSMPLRQAALRAAADAGTLAADLTVEVARAALKKRVERLGKEPRTP